MYGLNNLGFAATTTHSLTLHAGFANNAATAFQVQLQQVFSPLAALAALIHFQPNYTVLAPRFDELATDLLKQVGTIMD